MSPLIHCGRLKGQWWPTTGHSRTQRGTSLLPFPRGSGVTEAYKGRIPTGTPTPIVTLHPNPYTPPFCQEIPWVVCSISMTTTTDRIGGDCVKRCSKRGGQTRGREKWRGDKKTDRAAADAGWRPWKWKLWKQEQSEELPNTYKYTSHINWWAHFSMMTHLHIVIFIHLLLFTRPQNTVNNNHCCSINLSFFYI